MKIMLDGSGAKIAEQEAKFDFPLWQLRTPLTGNKLTGRPYGLDNGCFTTFNFKVWQRMIKEADATPAKFVCLPDIVGDARRTLELFDQFSEMTIGLPRALVLQDGIGNFSIPWDELSGVFVGGSDAFKIAPECINACKTAKILNKWVHVGRVNTIDRLSNWMTLGDSIDGSGISKYDHMLEAVIGMIKNETAQLDIFGMND